MPKKISEEETTFATIAKIVGEYNTMRRRRRPHIKSLKSESTSGTTTEELEAQILQLKKDLKKVKRERTLLKKRVKELEAENEELQADYSRFDIMIFNEE